MFLGRPVNQWIGLISTIDSTIITIIGATQTAVIAQQWAIILGAVGIALGGIVAFLAGVPPTLAPGDTFTVKTAGDAPNYTTVVAHPPAQDAPPMPQGVEG